MRAALTSSESVHLAVSSEAAIVLGGHLEFGCATSLFLGAIWNSGVQLRCFWGHLVICDLVCNFLFFGTIWKHGLKGMGKKSLKYSPAL
jgi:hypothetical protein